MCLLLQKNLKQILEVKYELEDYNRLPEQALYFSQLLLLSMI